jgi:hypothetical protein
MAFAPDGTFTLLDQRRAASAGRTGGKSRSKAKVVAAKSNGKLGGRTSNRSLIERILNRSVPPKQWSMIRDKVFSRILIGDQQKVIHFFGVHHWTDVPHRSWRSIPPHIRPLIRHIKACALIYGRWPKWVPPTFTVMSEGEFARWFNDDYRRRERAGTKWWAPPRKKTRRRARS